MDDVTLLRCVAEGDYDGMDLDYWIGPAAKRLHDLAGRIGAELEPEPQTITPDLPPGLDENDVPN